MSRKFIYLLLMFPVFWQTGALTTGMLTASAGADESTRAGHPVLHWQDSNHHHHEDGSLHAGDSGGSTEHMQAESVGNTGLLAGHSAALQALPSPTPAVQGDRGFTSPYPDGLLRPPKASI